jgi:hypothetical protein
MTLLPFETYAPGDFVAFTGPLRSGKTLGAVRLALVLSARYAIPVASNIPIRTASVLRSLDDIQSLRGAVVVWDEIQVSLDSREWAKSSARDLTRDLMLWGKRGLIVLYTSPAFATVDVRVRRLTRRCYVASRRGPYTVYDVYDHPLADDVLVWRYRFGLRRSSWYGAYDTLYGAAGESLKIDA